MTSHTIQTLSSVGSTDIERTECFPLNCSQGDVHSIAMDTNREGENSQILLNDKHSETKMAANETSEENIAILLSARGNPDTVPEVCIPKTQILKSLGILCTSFFLLFTSFSSLSNLQSSINKDEGIGTFSLVIIYVTMVLSSMFLGSILMEWLSLKLCMCLSMMMYVVYMAANFYPVWGTMVPASFLCGLAAGPLWASQSSYLSQLSRCYAKTTKNKPKDSLSLFFGIFYMSVNASKILGNLLASLVLKQEPRSNRSMTQKEIADCVANKQEAVNNASTLARPDDITIYSICGTWIGLAIGAIIILAFLKSFTLDVMSKEHKRKPVFSKFLSTARHLKNSIFQKLLTPIPVYVGLSTGFLTADFTKSIVGCTFGIHSVSDVMLCNGICNTLSAALIGRLVKNLGHLPFLTFTFLCFAGVQIFLIVWKPGSDHLYIFFIFAGLWGVADAIIKTQVLAIYGDLFVDNTEAAFGNYFVFEATGYIISFSYSTFVSTDIKLYILLGLLACSATSYYTVEYIDRKRRPRQDADSPTDC